MLYHVGDEVLCRVTYDDDSIVFDVDYNDSRYLKFPTKYFEVISVLKISYVLLLPDYAPPDFSVVVDAAVVTELQVPTRYLGKKAAAVRERSVGGRKQRDYYKTAIRCKLCNDWAPYAIANLPNDLFVCYSCTKDPRKEFKIEKLRKGG